MGSQPRFFSNNDGSFLLYCSPPMTVDDFVYEAVGRYLGTQVDAIVCHMFGFGCATPLFPTEVPEARGLDFEQVDHVSQWRQQQILKGLWAEGQDPWKQAVEAVHAAGTQYWAGMRFNDLHAGSFEWKNEFSANHLDYKLGDQCALHKDHRPGVPCKGLNFSIPEVRAHRLALVAEVCTRYDVDGFEWDFTRHAGHHFPDIEAGRPVLTDYMREVRKVLRDIGEKRGRPVEFCIRVPGSPKRCREIGLDLATWIQEGVIDIVSPAPIWDTVTDLPFDAFVAMAEETDCRIYGCITEEVGPGADRPSPAVTLRAGALNAWHQGIDGIYLFNFHHPTMYMIDDSEILSQLGDPATLMFRDKQYAVAGSHAEAVIDPRERTISGDEQLPVILEAQPEGAGHTVRFSVGDDLKAAETRGILDAVILRLTVFGLTAEDLFEFKLNGKALPETPHLKLHPRHYRAAHGLGSFQAHYALEYDLRTGDWICQGKNELELVLRQRNSMVRADFGVHDLRLDIKYRILPMRG